MSRSRILPNIIASESLLYYVWTAMKNRCYTPTQDRFHRYGGRGIKICAEWLGRGKFLNFYNWAMANGYKPGLTIERIDNDGNYCPENCRWATREEQANNKGGGKTTRLITYNGETKCIAQWAIVFSLSRYMTKKKLNILHN